MRVLVDCAAVLALFAVLSLAGEPAHAQISGGLVKIGVLNDESGPYAALAGPGSRVAALMAVEDFGAAAKGMKVEIVFADHQNKPEVGSKIARDWYDVDKVDVIVDVPTSSVNGYAALALGYFAVEGLPRGLVNIPLEYFENAIRWMRSQPWLGNGFPRRRGEPARILIMAHRRLSP